VTDSDNRFARVDTHLAVLKWMTGTILASVVARVIKTFFRMSALDIGRLCLLP
jgi:hypothetical protein